MIRVYCTSPLVVSAAELLGRLLRWLARAWQRIHSSFTGAYDSWNVSLKRILVRILLIKVIPFKYRSCAINSLTFHYGVLTNL